MCCHVMKDGIEDPCSNPTSWSCTIHCMQPIIAIVSAYITTRYQYSTAGKLPSLSLSVPLSSPLSVSLFVQFKWTSVALTLALLGGMPWMCQPASTSKQPRWRVWPGLLGSQPLALQQVSVLLMTYCRDNFPHPIPFATKKYGMDWLCETSRGAVIQLQHGAGYSYHGSVQQELANLISPNLSL